MLFSPLLVAGLLVGAGQCQRRTRPTRTQTQTQVPTQTQAQGSVQTLYGQCGGKNWSGPTACPTGAYCKNDGINEWYSQCVSIEDSQPVGDSPITTRVRTTTISVVGPTPTVVTTFITYLTPVTPPTTTTITLVPDDPYTPSWP